MVITWPSFEELKQMSTYDIINIVWNNLGEQLNLNEKIGKKDPIMVDILFPRMNLGESPYHIPEFGNFKPFNLAYSYYQNREIITASDYAFWGENGIELLKKLNNYFFAYSCTLPGLFFFLNLIQLNNESKFEYEGAIVMFFKLLTHHKLKTEPSLFKQHADYVLSMFYKLLANPTFRFRLFYDFIGTNVNLFKYIGMALAVTVPEHIQKQESVWGKLIEMDVPFISGIKPWAIMDTINWNNQCFMTAAQQLLPSNLIIQVTEGNGIMTMASDRYGNQVFITLSNELLENGSRDRNTRVKQMSTLIQNQLR